MIQRLRRHQALVRIALFNNAHLIFFLSHTPHLEATITIRFCRVTIAMRMSNVMATEREVPTSTDDDELADDAWPCIRNVKQ